MPETIGQRLKRAREYRHLTLEKAADATRIRLQYLRALEADDFSAMPSPVQARGFLRNYADYLGLDLEQMVEELRSAVPKPLPTQEVVFEGETAPPAAAEETRQAPAPEGTLLQPVSQRASLASSVRAWLQRLPRIWKAPAGQSVETQPQDIPPIEAAPSEKEEQPAPKKSRRKKASPAPEPDRQPASGPGPGPAPAPDAVPLAPAESLPQEPPVAEVAPKAPAAPAWESALAWAIPLRGTWQRLPRWARPLPAETEPETTEAGREEIEADIPSPGVSQPVESSQEIFDAIGSQLRQRREILSLTHDEIERHTRMRAQFLAALEDGRIEDLPSPVQTRGMLSNYATFLDLDADALLLRFADALQAQRRERHPARPGQSQGEKSGGRRGQPVIPQTLPRLRMFIAGDLVFGIGMIVLLVVFAVWGISRVVSVQSQQAAAEETAPSISEALLGTPVETVEAEATPIPVEDTPLPAPLEGTLEGTLEVPTLAGNVNVQVNIVAIERSYLRVVVDGEVAFDGRTTPGTVYPFEAEGSIEVLAGNASALRIIYNQRDLGLLGGFGQLVNYVYTADEVLVPTPAASPTPTLTPFDTPTPPATPSPSPSPTIPPAGETL
jgi:cytoskeletal protein RodZ